MSLNCTSTKTMGKEYCQERNFWERLSKNKNPLKKSTKENIWTIAASQDELPKSWRGHILPLSGVPVVARFSGRKRMRDTLRRDIWCSVMPIDINSLVEDCNGCRKGGTWYEYLTMLKLFPPTRPLEFPLFTFPNRYEKAYMESDLLQSWRLVT